MRLKLSFLTVVFTSALLVCNVLQLDAADRAPLADGTNANLLISPVVTDLAFEQAMKRSGWNIHSDTDRSFYSVSHVIRRHALEELVRQTELSTQSSSRAA